MMHRLAVPALAAALATANASAQTATLARDIRTLPDASAGLAPGNVAAAGGALYFAGRSDGEGVELWTSDGTAAGTRLVADLWPGAEGTGREPSGSSQPRDFYAANGLVFFTADDGNAGREVWRTDGTAAGTFMLRDVFPGPAPAVRGAPGFAAVGNTVYFFAEDPAHGRELWRTDGSAAGTELAFEGCTGPCWGPSGSEPPAVLGGYLFLEVQSRLWRSDGTAAGSYAWALAPRVIRSLTTVGDRIYFGATDDGGSGLWVTDNSAGGTRLVKRLSTDPFSDVAGIVGFGDGIVFRASDGAHGSELWRSDGTDAGTAMVKDVRPGPEPGYPTELTVVGGVAYFAAFDGNTGSALWRSDGTDAGTFRFDPSPGGGSASQPTGLVAWRGRLAFVGWWSGGGNRLWWSDGTSAGTLPVGVVAPVRDGSGRAVLAATATGVFFNGENAAGSELWRSDGTGVGTVLVHDQATVSSRPRRLTPVGASVVLTAIDDTHGREPWASEGTAGGTVLLGDLCPGTCPSIPSDEYDPTIQRIVRLPDAAVFAAAGGGGNPEPWTTDGTAAGTHRIGAAPASAGVHPVQLTAMGGRAFYVAADLAASGSEPWSTDGTAAGTAVVRDIYPGANSSQVQALTAVGDRLFFTASDGVAPHGLWTSDGTGAGTRAVDPESPYVYAREASAGAGLYFFTSGADLRRSDGTSTGTFALPEVPAWAYPSELTDGGAALYFRLASSESGDELWTSNGLLGGTGLLLEIAPGPAGAHPAHFTRVGDEVYFTASDLAHGVELWRSDGTAAGTVLVKDIVPGPAGSVPSALTAVNGRLYFAAYQPATGVELWTSDGTEAGTVLVHDLSPGPGSSTPTDLAATGGRLFLVADDGTTGREPWSLPLPPSILLTGAARAEGDAGTQPVTVVLRVGGTLSGPVEVAWSTQDGTAVAGTDYVAASGTLTFVPGGPDVQVVSLALLGDTVEEAEEDFRLAVSVTGGVVTVGAPARVVVLDDDAPVTVASAGGIAREADTGETTPLTVAVRLSGPRGVPVTVDFATQDGSATSPADYEARSGTLTFAPGTVERTVDLAVNGDRTLEFEETLAVTLSNAVNATVAPGPPVLAVIVDDESPARPGRSLAHGSVESGNFGEPGYFRLATDPLASYEAVLDHTGGSLDARALTRLWRYPGQAEPSQVPGIGFGRVASLRWFDSGPSVAYENYLRVSNLSGLPGGADETYRVRLFETTLRGPRFQNAGSNRSTLVLHNAGHEPVAGLAHFLDEEGFERHAEAFVVPARGVFVKALADLPVLAGLGGTLVVQHDGPYGTVSGKVVTADAVSGLAFDHVLTERPR